MMEWGEQGRHRRGSNTWREVVCRSDGSRAMGNRAASAGVVVRIHSDGGCIRLSTSNTLRKLSRTLGAAARPLDLDGLHALTRFVRPESYAGDGAMLAAAVGRTAVREGWFMVAQHLDIFREWRVRPLQPWSRLDEFGDYYESCLMLRNCWFGALQAAGLGWNMR